MDDIDREIAQAKIGRREEPLREWDHLRKPKTNTNIPAMRARDALLSSSAFRAPKKLPIGDSHKHDSEIFLVLAVILLIACIIAGIWTKLAGAW
jgi:hypothetical protein